MSHRAGRTVATALIALSVAASVSPVAAHEGGAARVTLTLHKDGAYRLDVTLDPEHLPPGSPIVSPGAFRDAFARGMTLDFDGVKDVPRPSAPAGATAGKAAGGGKLLLHYEGRIPAGAKVVRFRDDAPIGEILVEVRNEGIDPPERRWSRAGWEAGPFTVASAPPVPSVLAVVWTYLPLGFRHIFPDGLDHILFVLGLFFASRKFTSLFAQVTAFTVAHSITLGLAMLGVVSLPSSIVEPAIAISIVLVAVENLAGKDVGRARVAVVFVFGLLHGLGFAGALSEIGLPSSRVLPALASFNLGVELGQLTILALAFGAVGVWLNQRTWYRTRVTVPASIAIAAVGLYWTIERLR